MRALASVVLLLACGGCGESPYAILEVTLTLPPSADPGMERYVYPQIRRSLDYPFSVPWNRTDEPGVVLTDSSQELPISVVTTNLDDPGGEDLHVRLRFCNDISCAAAADEASPEVWFVLEHPLYLHQRTFWSAVVTEEPAERPTEPIIVDRCAIAGCNMGQPVSSYCFSDMIHFCELD